MKLRKLFLTGVLALAALPVAVNAGTIETIDLTSLGFDSVTGVNFGDVTGGALVEQAFVTGGTLSVGDTFSESGSLEVTNWKSSPLPGGEISSGLGVDYEIIFTFTGLTGSVTNIEADGTFDYDFDPFVGDIFLTIDTTFDGVATAGATVLGELEMLQGNGNFGADGLAVGNNGDNNLVLLFTSFMSGVFFDENGLDMSVGVDDTFVALGNLDNTILALDEITDPGGDVIGQSVAVSTNGIVTFAVPEPAPLALLGLGILALGFVRNWKTA